jgi:hypothetical protein
MKFNINGSEVEVDNEALTKAIEEKTESIDIKNDDLVVRSKEDFDTFTTNTRNEGQTIGAEIGRKELFKALEIDSEGTGAHKSIDKSKALLNTWQAGLTETALTDAKIEPDKKVQELNRDLETLRGNLQTEKDNNITLQSQFDGYKKDQTLATQYSSAIPDNVIIDKSDMATILRAKLKADIIDGKTVALNSNGEVMKNKTTLEPLSFGEAVTDFFATNTQYIKSSDGGAGGGDSGGGNGKQTIEEFTKEMIDAGHRPNDGTFNSVMQERIKAGTLAI